MSKAAASASSPSDDFTAAFTAAREQLRAEKPRDGAGGGNVTRPPPPGDFEGSGVAPIGFADGTYFLMDRAGQLRGIRARDLMHQSTILDIWGGEDAWLEMTFGYEGRGGSMQIPWDRVGAALMRACHRFGPWHPATFPPRYAGIWSDGEGRPLLHLGDVLRAHDGRLSPAGVVLLREHEAEGGPPIVERQVYVREPARRRPAPACAPADVADLRDVLRDLWRFRDGPAGAEIVLGWCAVALLGAAVRWRPNLVLLGPSGSGKTSLVHVIRAALPIHLYTNDTTKSGLETGMTGRPGPVVVDEAAQGDRAHAAALFDMMLPASGDGGTAGRRGAPDGHGRAFSVLGAVCYSAIHPPALKPEHMGRFTEVVLLQGEGDQSDAMRAAQAQAARLGPALFGRLLEGFPRWDANLRAMRAELVSRGATAREADQMGAILAGWWLLASDAIAAADDARACADLVAAYLRGAAALRDDSAGRRAWQALASTSIQRGAGVVRVPVGELVAQALPATSDPADIDMGMQAQADLRRIGLRVELLEAEPARRLVRDVWSDDEAVRWGGVPLPVVWFGRQHAELRRLYAQTDFAGEAWWRAMEVLPGARRSRGNIRIGKAYSGGAFVVPLAALDLPEGEGMPPAPPE